MSEVGDEMYFRAAIFAAVFSFQAQNLEAQTYLTGGAASFSFDGAQVNVSVDLSGAENVAEKFANLTPSCDPFCIAQEQVAEGIETVAEPRVLDFLVNSVGQNTGLLVDARAPAARAKGFIPGSVSLPHGSVADDSEIRDQIFKALGARAFEDLYNFSDARRLMVYDNGPSQSDAGHLITHLLEAGYPAEKLSYYRGGMQVWSMLSLTVQE
ncbi:MAG: rhodanese-like domain-containing protein [Sulfitobacter sp.]